MVSTLTLTKIAFGGSIVTAIVFTVFKKKIQNGFRKTEYVNKSMELLEGYPSAEKYLGKPIVLKNLDLGHSFHEVTTEIAKVALPVYGPKGRAELYSWSSKQSGEEKPYWRVEQLDLRLANGPRWTFYKNPQSQQNNSFVTTEDQSTVK